jgi:hypothetical protein
MTVWTSMLGVELVSSPASFGGYIIAEHPPYGAWHRFDGARQRGAAATSTRALMVRCSTQIR